MPRLVLFDTLPIDLKSVSHQAPLLVLGLLCVMLQLLPGAADWLEYSRSALAQGQLWRLVSNALVHTNLVHMLMNLAALLLIWMMFRHLVSQQRCVLVVAVCSVMVACALWLFYPQVSWYVGMSGALHGLFCYCLIKEGVFARKSNLLLLLGVIAKVGWEQWHGGSAQLEIWIGARVLVSSHLVGALSGTLLALVGRYFLGRVKARQDRG